MGLLKNRAQKFLSVLIKKTAIREGFSLLKLYPYFMTDESEEIILGNTIIRHYYIIPRYILL